MFPTPNTGKDPEKQAKAMKLLEDGKGMYRAATRPGRNSPGL
jgi:hypothetical protein